MDRLDIAARGGTRPDRWRVQQVTIRPAPWQGGSSPPRVFEPPTDVYETPDHVVVRLEVAGLRPEDLHVAVSSDGRGLSITGQRADPASGDPRKYYSLEIQTGEFGRHVQLPWPVDTESVSAEYSNGFLQIELPPRRPASGQARRVPIE